MKPIHYFLFVCFMSFTFGCTLYDPNLEQLTQPHPIEHHRNPRDINYLCDPGDPVPPNRVNTTTRLFKLRALMAERDVSAYIVPLDEAGRRTWISGFSGSNGDSIVTMNKAATWTDGRYFLQAAEELDCNWILMKMGMPETPSYGEWLIGEADLESGSVVGADPTLIGAQTWLDLKAKLAEGNLTLISLEENLIDLIWTTEDGRPEFEPKDIVVHPITYAGVSFEEKINHLREELSSYNSCFQSENNFNAMIVTEGDEIAWLFNLRGEGNSTFAGLLTSPLFESIAVIAQQDVFIWIHTVKLTPELWEHFNGANCGINATCVTVADIENAYDEIGMWANAQPKPYKILVTKPSLYLGGANYAIYNVLPEESVVLQDSPLIPLKAKKNLVEVDGMIQAHIRDAYACVEFFAFMEDQIVNQKNDTWDELKASKKLQELREAQDFNKGLSFTTIAASGTNAAVIHYTPSESTVAKINDSAIFLVDSGGQYLDGTTDITRTVFYGSPDPEIVEMYTRVLMGAIDLASLTVPDGTGDNAVDLATRKHIYDKGLDYRHGTGHGIGAYLKVHEGPIRIAMSGTSNPLRVNQFFSDEPGFYKDGHYGIRLESILRVVEREFNDTTFGKFIGFEPVTLVPFEPKLIDFSLMTPNQILWFNDYNAKIREVILPKYDESDNSLVTKWIRVRTEPINPALSNMVQKYL